MKKVILVCLSLALLATGALAVRLSEIAPPNSGVSPNAHLTALLKNADAAAAGYMDSSPLEDLQAPLYARILERKEQGLPADDLWPQVRALRAELGYPSRAGNGALDEGEDCSDPEDLGSATGVNIASGTTDGAANDFGPYASAPACWQSGIFLNLSSGGPDVTYMWTAPFAGAFTFSLCNDGTDYDSGLELYNCNTPAGPQLICGNDDACNSVTSELDCIELAAGQQVLIVVDGFLNVSGDFQLDIFTCWDCPDGAVRSTEPDCSEGYFDQFNNGCVLPGQPGEPHFEPIECGTTVCGTSGIYDDANGESVVDFDWYELTVTDTMEITLCASTSTFGQVALFNDDCPVPITIGTSLFSTDPVCLTACVIPGTYHVAVGVDGPCGTPYWLSVECGECQCSYERFLVDLSGGLPVCQCIYADCPNTYLELCIGPLGPDEFPIANAESGCRSESCEDECTPGTFLQIADAFYDPDLSLWCFPIAVPAPGCFCICVENVLPVELSSFEAVAGDGEVQLAWSTASESNLDRFEILRDGSTVAAIGATNAPTGDNYQWRDEQLTNGTEYSYSLVAVGFDGVREQIAAASATPSVTSATVTEYALHQNYPNPFNPSTQILFDLAEAGDVKLTVFNTIGQTVATLVNGSMQAGRHAVDFNAASLTSGLYFYRLEAGDFTAIRKMVLMK